MLKSCQHCGRIHDSKFNCGKKPKREKGRTDIDRFRSSAAWQHKREEIKTRDLHLCQICIRNLYGTNDQFNYSDLSVHHAIPLEQDFDKQLDNDNLLTMCGRHHEMAESGEIPIEIIIKVINEQENSPPVGASQ